MERWKDIPGYEGIYEASSCGRIRTSADKTTSNARYSVRHWKQRIIKQKYQQRSTGKRDARVCLWRDGKERTHLVSRLVAMAWCDGYSEGLTVNHIDGNPENNNADNLEWISLSDNIREGFRNGLFPCKPCSLIDAKGNRIDFQSYSEASRYLGKNKGFVSNAICKGRVRINDGEFLIVGK